MRSKVLQTEMCMYDLGGEEVSVSEASLSSLGRTVPFYQACGV